MRIKDHLATVRNYYRRSLY